MRTLNVKLFLIVVGGTVLASAGMFLVHHLQVAPIARALLRQAARAERDNHPDRAAKYLSRYLEFRPRDMAQRAHLGQLLADTGRPRDREQALLVLEQVINREPERHDLRRLVVRLGMESRPPRFKLVKEHLNALAQALPKDAEVAQMLGAYYEANKEEENGAEQAAAAYRQAIALDAARLDAYVRLADVLRGRLNRPEKADEVMDALVRANGASFRAFLLRGRYHLAHHSAKQAAPDLRRAGDLAPDDAEVILALAELAQVGKDYAAARVDLGRGIKLHPHDGRFYLALAQVEFRDNHRQEALQCLRDGVKVLTGPAQNDVLWRLVNALLDGNNPAELTEAEGHIELLAKGHPSPAAVAYLRARVLMARQDWSQAARLLERTCLTLKTLPEPSKELLTQIDLYLGQCYDQLNEPTRQLEAFSRVVMRDPKSVAGRLGVAAAQRTLGRIGASLEQYQQIAQLGEPSAERWVEIARLRLEQIFLQGTGDWNEVDAALDQAEKIQPDFVDAILLRAHALAIRKQFPAAQELLTRALTRQPKQVEFLTALSDLAQRQEDWPKAWAYLEQAQKECGDRVEIRLARAAYWANRKTPETGPALAKLGQNLKNFSEPDQARLLQGLAEISFRLGHVKEAEHLWAQLAQQPRYQKDLRLQLVLFDLAMQAGNEDGMARTLQAIQAIEGSQGTLARYGSALRLIWQAKKDHPELLDEARQLLDQVAAQRPSWPAVLLAKAEIEKLKGNTDQAIANYRKAMDLGDRSTRAIRPLVQLLYQSQRYGEADQVMELMRQQHRQALSPDLQRLWAEINWRNHNPARAMQLIHEAATPESNDYHDHLWLGQVLTAGGRPAEAEAEFRRAVGLADTVPQTWIALVQFLVGQGKAAAARQEIARAEAKLPADQKPLALAQCYEAVGQPDLAGKYYQQAQAAQPDAVPVLRAVAGFHMRQTRPQVAEPILRRIVNREVKAADDDVDWARRGLALALAARGGYARYQEALALVGLRLDDATGKVATTQRAPAGESAEEESARARVLAAGKLRVLRARAITLLEELNRRQTLAANDRFLLVQLYESERAWPKVCDQLGILLNRQGPKPLYLSHYVQGLLNQNKVREAEPYLSRLEKLEEEQGVEPGTYGTADLRVVAYRMEGRHDQAIALLKKRLARKGARPEEIFTLITYLGRAGRLPEALGCCEQAWTMLPPEKVAGASVALLRAGKPNETQFAQVESRLQAALRDQPKAIGILLPLADLEEMRGRYPEAETLYNRVLQFDPSNGVALNNLAWLLAFQAGNPEKARTLVEKAIAVAGPTPEFLDTRAVVFLALKQPEPAIKDLEKAANLDKPTWYRYFHLARAQLMANRPDAAVLAFRRAKELGLKRDLLHPVELMACASAFDELERK